MKHYEQNRKTIPTKNICWRVVCFGNFIILLC